MKLHVFFSPVEVAFVHAPADDIYIVIDVIRATTSLTVIFEQRATRVLVADTIEQAQQASRLVPGRLLCGERNALPLPGFDYGNSPVQFSQADLTGRELILSTTNGTRAFFACPEQSTRLAGCFYNAQAVAAYAIDRAEQRGCDIALVCAAERGYFALDDTVCAGYLALELQRQHPTIQADESVLAAASLYRAYPPPDLLNYCNSARQVTGAGLRADLDLCMHVDGSTTIPIVAGREQETGLLFLAPATT